MMSKMMRKCSNSSKNFIQNVFFLFHIKMGHSPKLLNHTLVIVVISNPFKKHWTLKQSSLVISQLADDTLLYLNMKKCETRATFH